MCENEQKHFFWPGPPYTLKLALWCVRQATKCCSGILWYKNIEFVNEEMDVVNLSGAQYLKQGEIVVTAKFQVHGCTLNLYRLGLVET